MWGRCEWCCVVLVLLAGCGRLGFDPVADGGVEDGSVDAIAADGAMDSSPPADSAPMDAPLDSVTEDTAIVEDGGPAPLILSFERCEPVATVGVAFECGPILNREPLAGRSSPSAWARTPPAPGRA